MAWWVLCSQFRQILWQGSLLFGIRQDSLAAGSLQMFTATLLGGLSRRLLSLHCVQPYGVQPAIHLVPALLSPLQGVTPGSSREELVWAVQHHFQYQEVRVLIT